MELCETAKKQTLDLAGVMPSHAADRGFCHRLSRQENLSALVERDSCGLQGGALFRRHLGG
jgi:hypothetical protein